MAEVVTTKLGKVKGKVVKLKDGKPVHVFRNIPFAKPPIGKLRFMPPQPAEPWEGVKDGTVIGNMPMYSPTFDEMLDPSWPSLKMDEPKPIHDEDCLHVTVYTPRLKQNNKLPVMIWLYGGGFQMGSEHQYDGSVLAGMNDVVVVIPNYRVGIFGLLSLGQNSPCTGNAGLLDQQMAMRWVQENIEDFGGDQNNVTVFGESAGGSSTHLNVLSPLAKGLFHKAISHSGTVAMTGVTMPESLREKNVKAILEHLKIEEEDNNKLLEALQNIPAKELIDACTALMEKEVYFSPMIDGKVIPKNVMDMMKEKDFAQIPLIVGFNNSEGHGILTMHSGKDFKGGFTEEEAKKAIFIPITDEGFELCKKEYLRDEDGKTKFSKLAGNAVGDGMFVAPGVHCASLHSEVADTYCYYGAFQLRMYHDKKYGPELLQKTDWCICDHGDEIGLTFGVPLNPRKLTKGASFTEEEANLSRAFMTYLTNFAKTSDPNKGEKVEIQWPKYKRGGEHLVIANSFSTTKNLGEKATKFWMEVMPAYRKEGY